MSDFAASESLVVGLDEEQSVAVRSDSQPLCVLAGAGSGKTRVLTRRVARRIADGTADAAHTLVLTFTRKAADELRERLVSLGVEDTLTVGTFHAVAYAELRRRWVDEGRTPPAITSAPLRLLENALATLHMDRTSNTRGLLSEISWAKSHRLTPDSYEDGIGRQGRRAPLSPSHMVKVFRAYEEEKRKRRVLDFDDLLLLLTDAIERDKPFAASQRWRFRHFFVDEFQDLNQAQFELLQAWLGPREDLFIVGDPNQAIYGWNGADASFLTEIDRWYPGVEKVRLTTNYRSTPQVLAAASAILPNTFGRRITESIAPDLPAIGDPPTLRRYPDERVEAQGIARHIRLACSGSRTWADAAILVRTNAQRLPIEGALRAAGIPFRSSGGATWLYRAEVRDALGLLKAAPKQRLAERFADVEQMAKEAPDETSAELLDEFVRSCRERLLEDPTILVRDFLSWLEVASRFDGPGQQHRAHAVTVTTFHRAKGLEWPIVFLAGLEDGMVPFGNNPNPHQLAEERRLFYVAVTRAREELHCSFPGQRTSAKGVQVCKPSPWLASLADARIEDAGSSVELVQQTISDSRTLLAETPVDSVPLRNALHRWRATRAHLTGIEPKLILADSIVDAIVDLRPKTREELQGVEGFGPMKLAGIGDEILQLTKDHP